MVLSNMALFLVGTSILFIASGLALIPVLWLSIFFSFFSVVFIIIRYFQKKHFHSNTYFIVSILLTFFFLSIGTFLFTVHISTSLEKLLLFISCFLLFLASSQYKNSGPSVFVPIFATVALYAALYILRLFDLVPLSFLTTGGYQMILPTTDSHNHLGDLIGLIIVISPFIFSSKYTQKVVLYLFVPILILSFSKSALLSLGVTFLVAFFIEVDTEKKQKMLFDMFRSLYVIVPVIMVYSSEFSQSKIIEPIQKYASYAFQITPKPLLSMRDVYFSQVIPFVSRMIPEQIGFGLGLGNFSYLSSSVVTDLNNKIGSAHNFFLNLFVEGGLLSVLWIMIFFALVIFGGIKKKIIAVLPVVYILINFQTDYTYQIPLMLFLLFFYAGQIHAHYSTSIFNRRTFFVFLLIGVVCYGVIFSQLYMHQNTLKNLNAYLSSVGKTEDKQKLYSALIALEREKPFDEETLLRIAQIYSLVGNHNEYLRVVEKLITYSPHAYIRQLPDILLAIEKNGGNSNEYLRKQKALLRQLPLSPFEKQRINVICKNNLKSICL